MEKHILIDISDGGMLYQFFYLLAFLAAYLIFLYEGWRRKVPFISWILLLVCIRLAVVIGTRVFSYTGEEWMYMLQNHTFIEASEKTMFGGALLGFATYLLVRKPLNLRYSLWDTAAFAIPAGISIQTVGCFFYGCCFGKSTDLPFAVQYPVMSLAHYHQYESGLLSGKDLVCLPVHPVQLYQLIFGIVVIILLFRLRKHIKREGNLLLCSLMLIAVARFITEFFRDPLSNKTGGEMLWILKQVQWQYLIFVFITGLMIFFRERKTSESTVIRGFTDSRLDTRLGILLTVMLIFLLTHKWFTWPEIIAINMAILPAVILTTIEIKKSFYRINYKWIYLAGILLAPVMMSQTVLEEKPDTAGIKSFNSYRTIGGGPSFGHFTTLRDNFQGSGCDRVSNTEYFNHEYKGFGGGYSFTKVNTDRIEIITYGVNSFFGEYTQVRQSDLLKSKYYLAGINPYIRYDLNWLGVGAGLHLGNLFYSMGDAERETTGMPLKGFIHTPIFPQFYLRLGPKRIIWTDFHLADQFPLSAPGMNYQLGLGSDFGSRSGFNIRTGYSLTEDDYYLSSVIPLKNKIVIEPFFQWSTFQNDRQFSIGISNRFGHKNPGIVP